MTIHEGIGIGEIQFNEADIIRAHELRRRPHTGLFAINRVRLHEGQHLRVPGGLEGHAVPSAMQNALPRPSPSSQSRDCTRS